jgi:hypothetical protein
MTKDEALKLALEALESCDFVYTFGNGGYQQFDRPSVDKAITAIKICLEKKWSDFPCYEWPGYRTNLGYGQLGTAKKLGKNLYAHRLVWEAVNGPIHDGLVLDHLCRNPACVNPHHLEPVTNKENILRGTGVGASNSKKTHCKSGHKFDELNTGFLKDGRRYCKECQRESTKKSRIKHGTR